MALTENEKRADKREKPFTKVVVRRLPPSMSQEQFLNQVSPVPDYNYVYHVKGDMSLGENAFARAYINFVCPEDVYSFKERFDNYVFVDSKGHEYPAVVEFAPFQKVPKKRGKIRMDPKCNTIEADSYYLDFVGNLNKPVEQDEKPEYTLQLNERSDEKKDTTTPLLEYIKNKRAQRMKIREVRREERERKRKEFERKKEFNKYYDDKKYDDKSPGKSYGGKVHTPKSPKNETHSEKAPEKLKADGQDDKTERSITDKPIRSKEKKFEERRKEIKPRFPKKEYPDSRDYAHREREYRPKNYDDFKKEDSKTYPKKVKKYSEKREERKIEAQKAEQRKLEQQAKEAAKDVVKVESKPEESKSEKLEKPQIEELNEDVKQTIEETEDSNPKEKINEAQSEEQQEFLEEDEREETKRETDEKNEYHSESASSRRIRNKDRPTIAIYRPGMLSKRKQNDGDESTKKE